MKNVVVLIGNYLPYPSANGNIAYNIIEELNKKEFNVTVLTRRASFEVPKKEKNGNIKIYRNNDWNLLIHNYCMKKIKKNKNIFKLILFMKKVAFYIPKIVRMQSFSKNYVKKIKKALEKIDSENTINILIPISAPHEEVFAALKYKEKRDRKKLLVYQLDRFSNGNSLYATNFFKNRKYQNNIQLEKRVLEKADKLFVLPPIYKHYKENTNFKKYIKKIEVTEHPLIRNMGDTNKCKEKEINLLYAGALDIKLRNPTYLLELLKDNDNKQDNLQLQLYSYGNCQAIIDNYKKELEGILFDYGKISHDTLIKKMKEANILVSIGNNSDEEVPSKLFEYMSFGKPIIHIYYSDKDAYLNYLKCYPYSICIKIEESNIDKNRKIMKDFCIKYARKNIDYKIIEEQFIKCTPNYVAKQFLKEMEENSK